MENFLSPSKKCSCEAIPEEIGDATPPKTIQIDQQKSKVEGTVSVVASGTAKNQHLDFIAKSNSTQNSSTSSSSSTSTSSSTTKVAQNSSVDSLMPLNQNTMPRKQHSADDALQQQDQAQSRQQPPMNEPRHSSSGSSININASSATKFKLNIDMPNLATKPPQSHAPLSPRLLSRNNLEMSHLNSSSNFNDFRGRSKTISVVNRGEHDNRDNSKWTFKGSKLI